MLALRTALLPVLFAPLFGGVGVRLGLGVVAVLLLLGLLTRIASVGAGTIALGAAAWNFWTGGLPMFGNLQVHWLVATVCVSLALVGPGAYSIDARLFGWRELTVPNK